MFAITSRSGGTSRNNYNGRVGFKFTVGAKDIIVDSLGRSVISTNATFVSIAIYNAAKSQLTSSSVSTEITPDANGFIYSSCPAVRLLAGVSYYILSTETNGGETWYDKDQTVGSSSGITIDGSAYWDSPFSGAIVTDTPGIKAYVATNFRYYIPSGDDGESLGIEV